MKSSLRQPDENERTFASGLDVRVAILLLDIQNGLEFKHLAKSHSASNRSSEASVHQKLVGAFAFAVVVVEDGEPLLIHRVERQLVEPMARKKARGIGEENIRRDLRGSRVRLVINTENNTVHRRRGGERRTRIGANMVEVGLKPEPDRPQVESGGAPNALIGTGTGGHRTDVGGGKVVGRSSGQVGGIASTAPDARDVLEFLGWGEGPRVLLDKGTV